MCYISLQAFTGVAKTAK